MRVRNAEDRAATQRTSSSSSCSSLSNNFQPTYRLSASASVTHSTGVEVIIENCFPEVGEILPILTNDSFRNALQVKR